MRKGLNTMNKEFTEGEIVTMYREAKDKKKQIRILTELCQADEEEILTVLKKYISPKELPRNRKAKAEKPEEPVDIPTEPTEEKSTADIEEPDYTDDDLDELLTDIDDYCEEGDPWQKFTDDERDILMDSLLIYCDKIKKLVDQTKECLATCEKKLETAKKLLQDFMEKA